MTARMLIPPCRPSLLLTGLVLAACRAATDCAQKHEAKSIPQLGTIDPTQPAEMRKVSQSPYVIEPPDELEITHQPPLPTTSTGPFVVQADGFVDLGLFGEVYVYGLTLSEAEERIAVQLNDAARELASGVEGEVPRVRAPGKRSEQVLLRLGNGGQPRASQVRRQRHGSGRHRARPA